MSEYVVTGSVEVQTWVYAETAAEALDKFRDLIEEDEEWSRNVDVLNIGSLSAGKLEED